MNMTGILALADLTPSLPERKPARGLEPGHCLDEAVATLDALVAYLDAICSEWAATSELDRLGAVRLAADTARQIQALLRSASGPGSP
jgi:hypothetical protein